MHRAASQRGPWIAATRGGLRPGSVTPSARQALPRELDGGSRVVGGQARGYFGGQSETPIRRQPLQGPQHGLWREEDFEQPECWWHHRLFISVRRLSAAPVDTSKTREEFADAGVVGGAIEERGNIAAGSAGLAGQRFAFRAQRNRLQQTSV